VLGDKEQWLVHPNLHSHLCWSAFQHCGRIPEINNFLGRRVYFGSCFHRFYFMVTWPCCFWACGVAVHHGRCVGTSWWLRSRGSPEGAEVLIAPSIT
jgi:hypothetical protein